MSPAMILQKIQSILFPPYKPIAANTPVLARAIIIPAKTTPKDTDSTVDLKPISKKLAPKVPVQAPVPGMGMPTNSKSAMNKPPRPAVFASF